MPCRKDGDNQKYKEVMECTPIQSQSISRHVVIGSSVYVAVTGVTLVTGCSAMSASTGELRWTRALILTRRRKKDWTTGCGIESFTSRVTIERGGKMKQERRKIRDSREVSQVEVEQTPLPPRTQETKKKVANADEVVAEIDAIIEENKEMLTQYKQQGGE